MSQRGKPGYNGERLWINPIGGYGDMLMVSGVLKLVVDSCREAQFNLVRRTKYLTFLKGHPAIAEIGYPPKDAMLVATDYWAQERLGEKNQRAFQIIARTFGLETPVEEGLYVPWAWDKDEDPLLLKMIPWKKKNVLIAPSSDSPRKVMLPQLWHQLVEKLNADGFFVLQAGRLRDIHIRNAYSALGLTTPRQIIALLRRFDVIITPDNFIMHAAHLVGASAVVLWGPTRPEVYGYPRQTHLQGQRPCESTEETDCIDPARNRGVGVYGTPCPMGKDHCMNKISVERIFEAVREKVEG